MTIIPAEQVEAETVDIIANPGTTARMARLLWDVVQGGWEEDELLELVFRHRDEFPDPEEAWSVARYLEEFGRLVRQSTATA